MTQKEYITLLILLGMVPSIPCLLSIPLEQIDALYPVIAVQFFAHLLAGNYLKRKTSKKLYKQDICFSFASVALTGSLCAYFFMGANVEKDPVLQCLHYPLIQIACNLLFLRKDYKQWFPPQSFN